MAADSGNRIGYLVLAAGKGTRMHSAGPKVLQRVLGKPLLGFVLDALTDIPPDQVWSVIGHGADQVRATFADPKYQFILQEEQRGTGHALRIAWPTLEASGVGYVCVVNGDTPFVPRAAIDHLLAACITAKAGMGILTLELDNPTGYGRIVRAQDGTIRDIVEEKDCDAQTRDTHEINAGIYVFSVPRCRHLLARLDDNNAQGEFYITQLVRLCVQDHMLIHGVSFAHACGMLGINTPQELIGIEETLRAEIVRHWIEAGVRIRQPDLVTLGPDAVLEPGVQITGPTEVYGHTYITGGAVIESHCWISNATLHACQVRSFSHIESAQVGPDAVIGPFARLRPGTIIEDQAKVGNFVEVKNSVLHRGAKASHLSYLGDSEIGADANIGAGTITCNYDGHRKHRTTIGNGAFIGSNTALVAPVDIGEQAVVGAGSVVTKAVPPKALCIARARQTNLQGWKPKSSST
ncbi:bifunctional UDP-N-acetylglucosamine diphosphorylase/glucosamine-1-phosphate N-acetyltransferase GlmU [Desulfovibrionales bacterium]